MKKLIFTIFLIGSIIFDLWSISYADIPRTINYQGKLTDKQGYALNGTYNITFRLYDDPTAGNLLWTEQHQNISVSKGLFSVLLGTVTPLNLAFDKQYHLSIQVGADPEMTPRQALASSPYAFTAQSGVPTGTIMIWSTDTSPNGWLLCDGSAISRTTYSALFNAIGTTYGAGDGLTTFNLPNLKGKVPVGYNSAETEFDTLGETGGAKTHSHSTDSQGSHSHGWAWTGSGRGDGNMAMESAGAHTHTAAASPSLPPYITLNYIIKI